MKIIKRLLYSATPFLLISLYLITLGTHTLITDGEGWGGVAAIVILFFSFILLAIDFAIRKIYSKYLQRFIAEFIIGALMLVLHFTILS